MRIQLRGEKIEITEAINSYVEEKISKLDKFFKEKDIQAKVTIKMNGKKHAIDVTIPYDKFIIRSEEIIMFNNCKSLYVFLISLASFV